MQALTGYVTIGVLILVGVLCAQIGVLNTSHQKMLSKVALLVSSPALMLMIMSRADMSHVFARSVLATGGAIVGAAFVYVAAALLFFRPKPADRTIGMFLSCYTNAGNLGLPVATYALGDAAWIAPVLLMQLAILQPLGMAHLDYCKARESGGAVPLAKLLTLPVRNPLTVGVLAGLTLNLLHISVPTILATPLDMLGGIAVPAMLLAFGVSLRLDPRPKKTAESTESNVLVVIKCLLQPLMAYTLARFAFGLPLATVRAVTIIAALPPAQNVYIFAMRYGVRELFARNTIFRATATSAVVIGLLAALL